MFCNLEKYTSSRIFENEPGEICNHLSGEGPKGRFFAFEKAKNHTEEGKGKEK